MFVIGENSMRSKDTELMTKISDFIEYQYNKIGRTPTAREIANEFNISLSTVSSYVNAMIENGMLEFNGDWRTIKTENMKKKSQDIEFVPIIGTIACGNLLYAEENIVGYLPVLKSIIKSGNYRFLKANGNSMVNAGIEDGDYILLKMQETAEEGQIVIALVGDEATLKRYYIDREKHKVRLHPENDEMEDMFFDNIKIQGIAVLVIKKLV